MIQLNILSGKKAGDQTIVRRFPFSIGRGVENDLQLDESGVWDRHLTLEFQKNTGFNLSTSSSALVAINGDPVQTAFLHNGDIITAGSVKFQFWLASARQYGLRARESFLWALIALVTAGQLALVYWLIR